VREIAAAALKNDGDPANTLHAASSAGNTIGEMLVGLVAKIGENMSLRRASSLSVSDGVVASYLHNVAADGMGKIGVLVALESTGDKSRLNDLGRKIAMHIASAKPLAATTAELDPAVVEKEKQILTAQAAESGKPANVIEKMVEGRIRKFYQESVLVEQAFVMDPDTTVGGFIEKHAKEFGTPVKLKGFIRYEVGEGIEKVASDFAAEVASFAKPKE
jgi:elongation factor Ts